MKKTFAVIAAALFRLTVSGADPSIINVGAIIPDGDLNGYQSSQTISGFSGVVSDVNIRLNISGGFNGDLYGYLFHNNSQAVLLNRVGRGSSSSVGYAYAGFGPLSLNLFTFDDQAARHVHFYRT